MDMFRFALLMLIFLPMFSCDSESENNENGTDSGNTSTDTDSDNVDTGDSDTTSIYDSDSNEIPENLLVFPVGASPDDLYGDKEMQLEETGFGEDSVDFALGGLHSDLPSPTYDCRDKMITQNCISCIVDIGTGKTFEYLWIGEDDIGAGKMASSFDGYGVFAKLQPPYAADLNIFVKQWPSTPATFEEAMVVGDNPAVLSIDGDFGDIGSGAGSSSGTNFREGKIAGWAAHTSDYGAPSDTVMVATFAATWIDIYDQTVRFRGTLKGYFRFMDMNK